MEENRNLENSLYETLTDNSAELSGEIIELTIDQFVDNDFLKEIPFFSIFYKSLKTVQGLSEALFAMKIYKFIKEFERVKQKDKEKILSKIASDREEKIKIGQTLIMIIDKITDLDKTQFISNLFAAYLKSKITKSEFIQLCSIIQNAFLDYLLLFNNMKSYNDLSYEIQSNLSSYGLMIPIVNDLKTMYGSSVIIEKNNYRIVYVVSKIGMKMKKYAFENISSR